MLEFRLTQKVKKDAERLHGRTIMNNNKQTGEETMNESYKDKFNAQMKKAGIDSLGDLKTDAEKKAFFKAVDAAHTAKNEKILDL